MPPNQPNNQTPNVIVNPEGMLAHIKAAIETASSKGLKVTEMEVKFVADPDIRDKGPRYFAADTTLRVKV